MDKFLYGCIYLSAAIAVSVLLMIICYVTVRGIGSVSLEFLTTVTSARKGTVGIEFQLKSLCCSPSIRAMS